MCGSFWHWVHPCFILSTLHFTKMNAHRQQIYVRSPWLITLWNTYSLFSACLAMVELLRRCILEGMNLPANLISKTEVFKLDWFPFFLYNRSAIVSSKTKESSKVFTLHLSREALLEKSSSELSWKVVHLLSLLFIYLYFCTLTKYHIWARLNSRLLEELGIHLKKRWHCRHIKVLPRLSGYNLNCILSLWCCAISTHQWC
jgi:hypothetical protein